MKYYYFVSHFYSENGFLNFANSEMETEKEIVCFNDIIDIAKEIAKDLNYKHSPTILCYKLLRVEVEE